MKNIIKIFCADFRRLSTNVVAVVVIMGLSVIPSLYAWFNILSNWDPYAQEATSNLKIAVVSQDEGTEVAGISMNIGDNVLSGLKENKTIGWVFPDTLEEATDGVYSGEYYAALVISKDFSKDMVSFMSGDVTHPKITYYENEKKNAIDAKDHFQGEDRSAGTGQQHVREYDRGILNEGEQCTGGYGWKCVTG